MRFKGIVSSVAVALAVSGLASIRASAQTAPSALLSANSAGLVANVVSLHYNNGFVSAQIILKNTNNVRVYIQDSVTDNSQTATLGSGENLGTPNVHGVSYCYDSYSECLSRSEAIQIEKFSYIDPGSAIGIGMQYHAQEKPANPDTISFSVTLMARFSKSAADSSPDDVGAVQEIVLSFPFVSFSQD